ncbi:exonuclease 3'-5' domain-containing protein 2-like [Littorina saxatilis]|uniref:Exonuclease 3'-5' domain-containing protein 2 n=1 Tax=Littorina saxatilis TaxID=31220 RepID=A0AAN9GJ99_9CAEN
MALSKSNVGKIVSVSTVLAGAGIALWLWVRRRRQIKLRHLKTFTDLNHGSQAESSGAIELVTSAQQWEMCAPRLFQDVEKTKVLGIDCEWVLKQPVALLQIATHSHYCVLVRLCFMDQTDFPQSLKTLLADKSILKVGVGVNDDALKLKRDYGLQVNGCVDLRDVLHRVRGIFTCEKTGLQGLAKGVLGIHISKDFRVRCGNWGARHLNQAQVDYAAMDAVVGVDVFMNLVLAKVTGVDPRLDPDKAAAVSLATILTMSRSVCQGIVDTGNFYKPHSNVNKGVQRKGGQANADRKQNGDAYSVRKRPLWDNCELLAPDGQLLCTCDTRKAAWYITKGLGVKVSEEPLMVKLNFEPSGRPKSERNYYLQQKENLCVVCGNTENYARKFVVPQEYRKYFPNLLKQHTSHDVLLMCPPCHRHSSDHDGTLRLLLAQECHAPLNSGENSSVYQDHDLQQVKSAGRALKFNRDKIPEARVQQLEKVLFDFYGVPEITDDLVDMAAVLDIKQENDDYIIHAKKVVEHSAENGGLLEFQATWRRHFVNTMQPKFLPAFWSVDYVPENWDTGSGNESQEEEEEGVQMFLRDENEESEEDEEDDYEEEEEDEL